MKIALQIVLLAFSERRKPNAGIKRRQNREEV